MAVARRAMDRVFARAFYEKARSITVPVGAYLSKREAGTPILIIDQKQTFRKSLIKRKNKQKNENKKVCQ